MKKKLLLLFIMGMMVSIAGCGRGTKEDSTDILQPTEPADSGNQDDTDEENEYIFEFQVDDVFLLFDEDVVVTGYIESGTVKMGDKAVLVKENGTKYETSIGAIEAYSAETDSVGAVDEAGEGMAAGVLLEGLKTDQVDAGALLLGYERE